MNIFYLDHNPVKAAEYHCDKHVVKMCLELAQLLSTTHRVIDGKQITIKQNNRNLKRYILSDSREDIMYKATHINHPSAIWTRQSIANYTAVKDLFFALCTEYTFRYNKTHLSYTKLSNFFNSPPKKIPQTQLVPMSRKFQAMPEEYKNDDPIVAYRNYYKNAKSHLFSWSSREIPFFVKNH